MFTIANCNVLICPYHSIQSTLFSGTDTTPRLVKPGGNLEKANDSDPNAWKCGATERRDVTQAPSAKSSWCFMSRDLPRHKVSQWKDNRGISKVT